jgi:hypothetical protein
VFAAHRQIVDLDIVIGLAANRHALFAELKFALRHAVQAEYKLAHSPVLSALFKKIFYLAE